MKTIKVEMMLNYANDQLARADGFATKEFKAGICVMIEQLLMRSGNYKGFRFLHSGLNSVEDIEYYSRSYYSNQK